MADRDFVFIVGPETSTLPTASTPSASTDIVTKGYADSNYASLNTAAAALLSPWSAANLGLSATVGSNALTIALKQADGSTDPSTADAAVRILFRSATLTTGASILRTVTSAVSLVVPDTATLGTTSAVEELLYVYAIDNAGTVELAVSLSPRFRASEVVSTTAIGTGSDDGDTLYSTSARSNVACRLIGTIRIEEATAGTWATAPVMVSPITEGFSQPRSFFAGHTYNGRGSTATRITRLSTVVHDIGTDFTWTDSSTNGGALTINRSGIYVLMYQAVLGSVGDEGLSLNASSLTTDFTTLAVGEQLLWMQLEDAESPHPSSVVTYLKEADVVRLHGRAQTAPTQTSRLKFYAAKVSD